MEGSLGKVDRFLNSVIASFSGVFLGHVLYKYSHFKENPGLYEMQSAPWYMSIQIYALVTCVILTAAVLAKCFLKKKRKTS